MRYEALLAFFTTVKERSFSAAARKLYMTQPAVSSAIKQLEQEFGQSLLIRKPGGGFEITDVGERVFQIFKGINEQFEQLELVKQEYCAQLKRKIIIECNTIGGVYLISSLSSGFQAIHPEFLVSVQYALNPKQRILNGECDLIFFVVSKKPNEADNPNLTIINAWEDEHSIIVSKSHPLAGRKVTAEDLSTLPFILAPKETPYRTLIDNVFQEQLGHLPNCALELNNPEAVKTSVVSLNKAGIVYKSTIQRELKEGTLVSLDTSLNLHCEHILAIKKYRNYSESLKLFLKYLSTTDPNPHSRVDQK